MCHLNSGIPITDDNYLSTALVVDKTVTTIWQFQIVHKRCKIISQKRYPTKSGVVSFVVTFIKITFRSFCLSFSLMAIR